MRIQTSTHPTKCISKSKTGPKFQSTGYPKAKLQYELEQKIYISDSGLCEVEMVNLPKIEVYHAARDSFKRHTFGLLHHLRMFEGVEAVDS